jgi:hypothetical protein
MQSYSLLKQVWYIIGLNYLKVIYIGKSTAVQLHAMEALVREEI